MMKAIRSSVTPVLTGATRHNFPEAGILQWYLKFIVQKFSKADSTEH
jgi:hypothetical protein